MPAPTNNGEGTNQGTVAVIRAPAKPSRRRDRREPFWPPRLLSTDVIMLLAAACCCLLLLLAAACCCCLLLLAAAACCCLLLLLAAARCYCLLLLAAAACCCLLLLLLSAGCCCLLLAAGCCCLLLAGCCCSPRRIAGSALPEPTPATPNGRRASSESSRRPSTVDLVVRAPDVPPTHVRAALWAAVRRVTSPRLILLSSSHRRLGSLRADTGDAERAPSRERIVAPTERRRHRRV
jgi:hypothetical protein